MSQMGFDFIYFICGSFEVCWSEESKAIAELKGAVDSASVLGLRSRKARVVKGFGKGRRVKDVKGEF